jgi:hypothetical protein
MVGTNTEDNEEEAFHPEDDVMYDDSMSPTDENATEAAGNTAKEELEEGEQQQEENLGPAEEEYEYEAADGVNAEEDNDYQEYEDDDDDLEDDDDFARKVGVLIS